jgi:NitT/TauT family transport system substrate-binding protein
MTSRARRPAFLAWICVSLALLSACSPPPRELRIGINAWPGYEFLYLARQKGLFAAEGVDVEVVEFNSLPDARRAFERGQIDGLGTTVIEVLQARSHSERPLQIVRVVDYSDGADVVLARGGIQSVADLRGKRVGVELASLGVYVLARALETGGLSLGEVQAVPSDQLSMEEAFASGELDAVVTYPPSSVRLSREARAATVFTSASIPGEVIDVLAVDARVAAERPGDVVALLRGFERALAYARTHPDDAYAIMAAREGITAQEFAAVLADGVRLVDGAAQAQYFAPGGSLDRVIDASDRYLRAVGQLDGPDRRAGAANGRYAAAAFPGGDRDRSAAARP